MVFVWPSRIIRDEILNGMCRIFLAALFMVILPISGFSLPFGFFACQNYQLNFGDTMTKNITNMDSVSWKLSDEMRHLMSVVKSNKHIAETYIITFQDDNTLRKFIESHESTVNINFINEASKSIVISTEAKSIFTEIIFIDKVIFIERYHTANNELLISGFEKSINKLSASDYYYPQDDGKGITVGIKENAVNSSDIDIVKRVLPAVVANQIKDIHATSIATIVGGAGNSFVSGKGVAPACLFYSTSYDNLFADNDSILSNHNITVQNHSYGTIVQSYYGAEAMSYDIQTYGNKNVMHVFSCGNKGTSASTTGTYIGISGYANCTGNFKLAKNIIAVAAIDTSNTIAAYSSSGPAYDGRMLPQLAALGANGTSEAAAIVSGACARLQQIYQSLHMLQLPTASMVKAALYCTADDIGAPGIDYKSGFGAIDILQATSCIKNNQVESAAVGAGQAWEKTVVIPPQTSYIKVALAWTDTACAINSTKALINNLDIEVEEVATGKVFLPWCLNTFPHTDSLKLPPIRAVDNINNAELVSIELPTAGQYIIRVKGQSINTQLPQEFAIAYAYDSISHFRFLAPLQHSDLFFANELLLESKIKWESGNVNNTDLGILAITYNNGSHWDTIASGIPLSWHQYEWLFPDTDAVAQLRMSTAFGNYYSPPFLLSSLCALKVNYLCNDSLCLSWNRLPLAQSYKIYYLGDSAFMHTIAQLNDTFMIIKRKQYPSRIYAVEPIIGNSVLAQRSFAIDIMEQGVGCMYNSFYGFKANDGIDLFFETSFPQGIDSVVFYRLESSGDESKVIADLVTDYTSEDYVVKDASPLFGANSYQAKIWIGSQNYSTEIITVLHNGPMWMYVYPNPIASSQSLQYVANINNGRIYLEIFDVSTRICFRHALEANGELSIQNLNSGLHLLVVKNEAGELLQSIKLLVE